VQTDVMAFPMTSAVTRQFPVTESAGAAAVITVRSASVFNIVGCPELEW
jgi:hypothetical protein